MRHLRAEEFVDIAEGTRAESSAAHLAACEACRRSLADVRAAMAAAADADVPEPSPLFWNHLSQRVRDAIAAGEQPRADGWRAALARLSWRHAVVEPIGALAVVVAIVFLAVTMMLRPAPRDAAAPGPVAESGAATAADAAGGQPSDALMEADPLLSLVATFASMLDVDAGSVLEDSSAAEHAVAHLSDAELREMQRLLQDALQRHSGD